MFEKLVKLLTDFQVGIKNVWDCLPKEAHVLLYVLASAILTVLNEELKLVKVDNRIVMGTINIILVTLAEMPTRIRTIRDSK